MARGSGPLSLETGQMGLFEPGKWYGKLWANGMMNGGQMVLFFSGKWYIVR
jgi:hypothetical protein